jgi:beta-lactamase regulating signal transducer with metallopeptidase domain/tetratricopeptide (TPR) repeat protein
VVECYDVTPRAFALLHPDEKIIEADLRVSVRIEKGEEKDVQQLQFEITSPGERLRVIDFLPRTQIEAGAAASIETIRTTETTRSVGATLGGQTAPPLDARAYVLGVWMAGLAMVLAPLAAGFGANRLLVRKSRRLTEARWVRLIAELSARIGLTRTVAAFESPRRVIPMTLGLLRPTVLVPQDWRDWPHQRQRCVLLHELAHVKRLDVGCQVIGRLAAALYWFNPLVWFAVRQLRIERELACDDCVLASGERASDYARELLETARLYRLRPLAAGVAMAHSARLDQRVLRILDEARSRLPLSRRAARWLFLTAAVLVLGVGATSLVERSTSAVAHEQADAADAIINKGIKALGGEAALAKAKATTSKIKGGNFFSGDYTGEFKIEETTDGLDRMRSTFEANFDGNKFTRVTVIDGDKGWFREGEMEVVELEGQKLADQKWGTFWQSVPSTLVELRNSKFKIEAVDDEEVDDEPAAGVKVTGPEGKDFTIYFDKKTGLPVKAVADMPDPESPGQDYTHETYYSDYKDFGGIKRATKVEITRDGETIVKMELVDFKVLDKVDDKTFAKLASAADPGPDRVAALKEDVRRLKEDVRRLTDKIEQDPTDASAFLARGLLRRTLGELDKAIEDYDEAIRLDPKNSHARVGRGETWGEKGDSEKELADFDEAIRLDPKNSVFYGSRGGAWENKGEWDKALADYDEAIRLDPKNETAYASRAYIWRTKGDLDKALADYDEAIRLDPKNSHARVGRGETWGEKGDSEKALADFDAAIRLDPKASEAYIGRGHAWLDKGEYDRALADFNAAVRLDPTIPKHILAVVMPGASRPSSKEPSPISTRPSGSIRRIPKFILPVRGPGQMRATGTNPSPILTRPSGSTRRIPYPMGAVVGPGKTRANGTRHSPITTRPSGSSRRIGKPILDVAGSGNPRAISKKPSPISTRASGSTLRIPKRTLAVPTHGGSRANMTSRSTTSQGHSI